MLAQEKPKKIIITRPVMINRTKFPSKSAKRNRTRSFNRFIRERLSYKCQVHSIELVEMNSKGTGSICSCCGAEGTRTKEGFRCAACGYEAAIRRQISPRRTCPQDPEDTIGRITYIIERTPFTSSRQIWINPVPLFICQTASPGDW